MRNKGSHYIAIWTLRGHWRRLLLGSGPTLAAECGRRGRRQRRGRQRPPKRKHPNKITNNSMFIHKYKGPRFENDTWITWIDLPTILWRFRVVHSDCNSNSLTGHFVKISCHLLFSLSECSRFENVVADGRWWDQSENLTGRKHWLLVVEKWLIQPETPREAFTLVMKAKWWIVCSSQKQKQNKNLGIK